MSAQPAENGEGRADASWPGETIGRAAAPLRERVHEVVRQAILDLKLRPGQRLIERELIERLGVSRTTVRDVIGRLAVEGLVTVIPQKGAIVSVLSLDEATDIYDMRASLEGLAARRFVERASPTEVVELGTTVEEIDRSAREDPADSALSAKDRFYEVLLSGARSPRLTSLLTGLQDQVRQLRATSLSVPGRPIEAAREIHDVMDAVEAGDADAAADACARHVRNAARVGLARLNDLLEATEAPDE